MSSSLPLARVEILRAACCIAAIDNRVCARERSKLALLAEHAGVGTVSLNAMIARAESDPDFYQDQFSVLKTDPEATITALFTVACADGQIPSEQRIILRHFGDVLGLDEKRFNQILDAAEKQVRD